MKNQPQYRREAIADAILARVDSATTQAVIRQFTQSRPTHWLAIDDLLPADMARTIYASFPAPADMRERKTMREHKYVAAQMNQFDPQAEEALFAFQDPRVVGLVSRITGITRLEADPNLYAGGISVMLRGNFLNPHLDNSHNGDRTLYRVLNLLYYVSPDWALHSGGNLELWPNGVTGAPVTIPSLFNRLVIMTTGPSSWHSVCPILVDAPRCCVSNYYFSPDPVGGEDYFRVTRFRGRPEQPVRDLLLRVDGKVRQAVRRLWRRGIVRTTHIYKRIDGQQ